MACFFPSNGAGVMVVVLALGVAMAALAPQAWAEPSHHVVGGDRGWDVASNIAEWADGKVFSVGDSIWFAYSAGEESIVEVGSKEELDACDMGKPIRMYTDGLNEVPLDGEGPRYFASGRPESCRGGLRLHVEVVVPEPRQQQDLQAAEAPVAAATEDVTAGGGERPEAVSGADGPSASGSSHRLGVSVLIVCVGMALALPLFLA